MIFNHPHRFVKCRHGTTKWVDEPRDAKHVSESISRATANAGLPEGTTYGFRKGAAEQVSLIYLIGVIRLCVHLLCLSITNSTAVKQRGLYCIIQAGETY